MSNQQPPHAHSGFTLFETLIILVILGILAGIISPTWIAFVQRQRLNTAQSQVYQAMRTAQSNATRDKITWQASFQENNGVAQWAVHPASINAKHLTPADWHNLASNVRLDSETNLPKSNGIRRLRFNYQGCPVYRLDDECTHTAVQTKGRITLSSPRVGKTKRCVIVSTLIGALRTAREQPKPDRKGRYCY